MIKEQALETIRKILNPYLDDRQFDLVELGIFSSRSAYVIRVLTDRATGGITLQECAQVNRYLYQALEKENVLDRDFSIDVASPGLDRPLKTPKDFKRVIGRDVRVHLSTAVENKLEYAGAVQRVEDETVWIHTKETEMALPLTKIQKAVQIV